MDLVDQAVSLFEQQVPRFITELEMATREQMRGIREGLRTRLSHLR